MLPYVVDFITEEIDQEIAEDGTIIKSIYGVERIPDIMLLTEMEKYEPGLNVDRLISFAALIAFIKVQESNRGYIKKAEYVDDKHLHKSNKISKLNKSAFRHVGNSNSKSKLHSPKRSGFRNLK